MGTDLQELDSRISEEEKKVKTCQTLLKSFCWLALPVSMPGPIVMFLFDKVWSPSLMPKHCKYCRGLTCWKNFWIPQGFLEFPVFFQFPPNNFPILFESNQVHGWVGILTLWSGSKIQLCLQECVWNIGGTLLRDNCQIIGMPLIALAWQAQKNCD